jgi:hypothetical protein
VRSSYESKKKTIDRFVFKAFSPNLYFFCTTTHKAFLLVEKRPNVTEIKSIWKKEEKFTQGLFFEIKNEDCLHWTLAFSVTIYLFAGPFASSSCEWDVHSYTIACSETIFVWEIVFYRYYIFINFRITHIIVGTLL